MTKAEIQFVRSLADKRFRDESGCFIAEGEKLIGEIMASPLRIRRTYALEGVFDGVAETVTTKEMERISMLKTPNNSLAVVEIPHHRFDADVLRNKLVLALDDVQNPGNLGTIIRLADWFGIDEVICSPATADCFNPKVVQATMGAILRVRVHSSTSRRRCRRPPGPAFRSTAHSSKATTSTRRLCRPQASSSWATRGAASPEPALHRSPASSSYLPTRPTGTGANRSTWRWPRP